jgi:hypothetical protein
MCIDTYLAGMCHALMFDVHVAYGQQRASEQGAWIWPCSAVGCAAGLASPCVVTAASSCKVA